MPLANFPAYGVMSPQLISVVSNAMLGDVTTTSTAYVDLLSNSVTTTVNGFCAVTFHVSGSNATNNTNVRFQLVVDGVVQRGAKFRKDAGAGGCASLYKRVALNAGSHTIKIQWSVSSGTGRIRPASLWEESAWMLIEELAR